MMNRVFEFSNSLALILFNKKATISTGSKLLIYLHCFTFVLLHSSCSKEEIVDDKKQDQHKSPIYDKVKKMGLRTDMIEEYRDFFLVEGDICFPKEASNPELRQSVTDVLVSRVNIRNVRVFVDNSIPVTGAYNWRPAIVKAIGDWNNIEQCLINFIYVTSLPADIIIVSDNNALPANIAADAVFPSNGKPGNKIRVNMDLNFTESQRRRITAHELGHCIGFRHTNWKNRGEDVYPFGSNLVYSTSFYDSNSIMYGGNGGASWQGFTKNDIIAAQMTYYEKFLPGVGSEGDGADIAIGNIGGTEKPDIIFLAYDDPDGSNTFRYRIGYDLDKEGIIASLTNYVIVPGVGDRGNGVGVSIAQIDADPRPDLIFMAYDDPANENQFRYRIGWNINTQGITNNWSNIKYINGVGHLGEGAGLAVSNIDNDSRLDLIFMAYDAPRNENDFRYRIAYNLNSNGDATTLSDIKYTSGVGHIGEGAGIAIANLDKNPRPDLVLMAYDAPSGVNQFRYRVLFNINHQAIPSFTGDIKYVSGLSSFAQGAGAYFWNIDNDDRPELFFMCYDAGDDLNYFKYKVGFNIDVTGITNNWR